MAVFASVALQSVQKRALQPVQKRVLQSVQKWALQSVQKRALHSVQKRALLMWHSIPVAGGSAQGHSDCRSAPSQRTGAVGRTGDS